MCQASFAFAADPSLRMGHDDIADRRAGKLRLLPGRAALHPGREGWRVRRGEDPPAGRGTDRRDLSGPYGSIPRFLKDSSIFLSTCLRTPSTLKLAGR